MKTTRITLIHISVISIMALFLYSYSFNNKFVWDDLTLIPHNDKIQHLSQIPKLFFLDFFDSQNTDGPGTGGYYRPLVIASFAVDHAIWGENPRGYHLTNLLLHLANALLVYWLCRRLLKRDWAAFWVALLFAVHPLQVDAVAYISGRTDVLATTFILGTLACIVRRDEAARGKEWLLAAALLGCAGALLSKEIGLALPPLLFLYWSGLRRQRFWNSVKLTFPFFLLTALYFELRNSVLQIPPGETLRLLGGACWRFLCILVSWAESFRLFVWPSDIYFERFQSFQHHFTWPMGVSAGLFAASLAGLVILWRKNRALFFFAALYWLALLPVLQIHPMFVQNYLFWTEHFFYLPCVGLFAVAISGIFFLVEKFRLARITVLCAAVVWLAPLSIFTVERIREWKDEQPLFEKALRYNPESARAHNNLGLAYEAEGKKELAAQHLEKAVILIPDSPGAYNNLGNLHKEKGDFDKAIQYYQNAIMVGSNTSGVFNNLASLYSQKGNRAAAEKIYLIGILVVKDPYQLYNNLGMLYVEDGRSDSALLVFEKALQLKPDFVSALNNVGILLAKRKLYGQAENYFKQAVFADPNLPETHNNLGNLYLLMRRYPEARAQYKKALEMDPGYQDPLAGLERLAKVQG